MMGHFNTTTVTNYNCSDLEAYDYVISNSSEHGQVWLLLGGGGGGWIHASLSSKKIHSEGGGKVLLEHFYGAT